MRRGERKDGRCPSFFVGEKIGEGEGGGIRSRIQLPVGRRGGMLKILIWGDMKFNKLRFRGILMTAVAARPRGSVRREEYGVGWGEVTGSHAL